MARGAFFKTGIRVNSISWLSAHNQNSSCLSMTGRQPEVKKYLMPPMERFGVPEELTGTLLYLASDLSKFVTGVVIPVDGGFSAYSGV
jgi:NAD(P)-dependent dehydrogenase (short-subunit alcohol dehydrogenase family)